MKGVVTMLFVSMLLLAILATNEYFQDQKAWQKYHVQKRKEQARVLNKKQN